MKLFRRAERALVVNTDRTEYRCGDAVEASVTVGQPLPSAGAARVELVYSYYQRTGEVDAFIDDLPFSSSTGVSRTEIVDTRPLPWQQGSGLVAGTHRVTLAVPVDGPPTVGIAMSVKWSVRVVVDRAGSKPLHEDAKIKVFSVAESCPTHARHPGYRDPASGMAIEMPSRAFPVGGEVAGTLVVAPLQGLEARKALVRIRRVEFSLERLEKGTKPNLETHGNITVAGPTVLSAGEVHRIPFAVTVPDMARLCPSSQTPATQVVWLVEAVLSRSGGPNFVARLPVTVYNAPPGSPSGR